MPPKFVVYKYIFSSEEGGVYAIWTWSHSVEGTYDLNIIYILTIGII